MMDETNLKEEEEFISRAKENLEDFSLLYDLYFRRMFAFFITRLGNEEDAEDMTSQTFLKALEHFQEYTFDGKPFGVWLFRIARNLLIDRSRKKKFERVDMDDVAEIAGSDDPQEKTHVKLLYEKVEKHLSLFSPEEREIILLKFTSGLKFSEIALIIGKNESTVKTKYFRTLNTLRGELGELILLILLLSHLSSPSIHSSHLHALVLTL